MPPEGSPERDSAMQDLGSEKDGKSTGGDKEKGKEDEKGKEGEGEKGGGEEEKAKAAQAMFDPKADPAMGARLDREKAANDKLAQKDKEDSDAEKSAEVPKEDDKLIYVYDFLKMWTFYVEVIEISDEKRNDLPQCILTVGEIPDEAPEKEFVADKLDDGFGGEEDIDDEFIDYDSFDYNEY